jgi:hypothetical protein
MDLAWLGTSDKADFGRFEASSEKVGLIRNDCSEVMMGTSGRIIGGDSC